jgi:hypothetical protein
MMNIVDESKVKKKKNELLTAGRERGTGYSQHTKYIQKDKKYGRN